MENTLKKYGQVICFTPLISFLICIAFFLFINRNEIETRTFQDHISVITNTAASYNTLFWMFAVCFVLHTAILLYIVVHLARLKSMAAGTKIFWITFITFLFPVATIIFWYNEVRHETKFIEVHADIS